MDAKLQTSFIPRRAFMAESGSAAAPSVSVFLVVSIIFFIASLVLTAGVFIYQRSLVKTIADMDSRLARARNSFEPDFITRVSDLNKRIDAAKKILNSHSLVSPVFDMLERDTLTNIRFDSFKYELKGNSGPTLTLTGQAKNFNSVALQSDVFGKEKIIKNPVFSNVNPDPLGNVVFSFTAAIDPNSLLYKNYLSSSDSAAAGADSNNRQTQTTP